MIFVILLINDLHESTDNYPIYFVPVSVMAMEGIGQSASKFEGEVRQVRTTTFEGT